MNCNNAERSCKWTGTVATIEKHLTTCKFALLPCPKKCKDSRSKINQFMRKNLSEHLTTACPNRHYKCAYCGEEGTYATIIQVHDEICQKKLLRCTSTGCLRIVQRQHISQHVESECEHTVIACKHKSIGCETEMKRKDMAAHELDDKLHLHMAINTITLLKEDSDIMLKQGESLNIRFADYQVRKESKKHPLSPSFYTSHGYNMALRVDANGCSGGKGTHVSVFAKIMKGKHDSRLNWPFLGCHFFIGHKSRAVLVYDDK